MAEENQDGQEKTEEATEERRDLFRTKGDIAYSRELTSVAALLASVLFITYFSWSMAEDLRKFLTRQFNHIELAKFDVQSIMSYFKYCWVFFLKLTIPLFLVIAIASLLTSFLQTRFNFSFEKIKPSFSKINPLSGFKRIFSSQSILELFKSLSKMGAILTVSSLIFYSDWYRFPGLMRLNLVAAWNSWGYMVNILFWSVAALLLAISIIDYIYNYIMLENKMKMTKQELKEDYKQREIDPMVKGRLRKLQRDLSLGKTIEATKKATVVVTNPTHYSVALQYSLGMSAPVVLAKGSDFLALRMREVAAETGIPVVENKIVARTLYNTTKIGDEIPSTLYKAVSEIIRYVFKIKGITIAKRDKHSQVDQGSIKPLKH